MSGPALTPEAQADLARRAQAVLRANDRGAFTQPAPGQYPYQWNWDSALIALGLAHFDLERALLEIRSLLQGQWRDGLLPHIVYHGGPSGYFPNAAFWHTARSPAAPALPTSGLTQPPVLASIVRRMHERHSLPAFVREVVPPLLAWHRWLHTARAVDETRLACLVHPWESGTDDSPRWRPAIDRVQPADVPAYRRGDTVHVAGSERPHDDDYDRFVYLVDQFRQRAYDPPAMLAQSPFLVQDVLFNSILHRADEDLLALMHAVAAPTGEVETWLATVREHFSRRFWDESAGLYFDYDVRAGQPLRVTTAMTFAPLYGGLCSTRQAHRLIDEHWSNPAEFAPGDALRYAVTTTSHGEASWEPRRYWRGPVWINFNWLMMDGLRHYGFERQADELRASSLALIARSGFREYFDPRDGAGCGSHDFSWSAALALEFLSAPGA